MKSRRRYKQIANEIECFFRNIHGMDLPGAEMVDVDLDRIKKYIKEKIDDFNLIEVQRNEARIVCIGFVQKNDDEGYDICGVKCYLDANSNFQMMYCGVCGDVNRVDLMKIPHVTFFCK